MKEFSEVQSQIVSICSEIAGTGQSKSYIDSEINERDLTAKKLGELKLHLQELQSEKVASRGKFVCVFVFFIGWITSLVLNFIVCVYLVYELSKVSNKFLNFQFCV